MIFRNNCLPVNRILTPPRAWYALAPRWSGGKSAIAMGLPPQQLALPWQILLLGDGSPTRHLGLLTGEGIAVDVLDMSRIGDSDDGAPPQVRVIPGPRLRRQVWLRTTSGQRLAYAVSWWAADQVDDYLQNRQLPIWENLAQLHTELYRDVQGVYYGDNSDLAIAFGDPGPFWGRHYLFWHDRQPLTLIYEVFSPHLRHYLGPLTQGG